MRMLRSWKWMVPRWSSQAGSISRTELTLAAFQPAALRADALAWVRGTGPPYVWQFSVIRC